MAVRSSLPGGSAAGALSSSNWCPSSTPSAAPSGPMTRPPRTPPVTLPIHFMGPGLAVWARFDEGARLAIVPSMSADTVFRTQLSGLERIHEGKVRDIYALDEATMLIVTTDRLSAFDVVLPDPIPGKGAVLNNISNFWFARTRALVPNHLTGRDPAEVVQDPAERAMLSGRAVVVKRLRALPIEAVVRGYLIGSGWKDYQAGGAVCGIALPKGLQQAARLPTAIFTPASKAPAGQHDENISFEDTVTLLGESLAVRVRDTALELYRHAADHARQRGIIIA